MESEATLKDWVRQHRVTCGASQDLVEHRSRTVGGRPLRLQRRARADGSGLVSLSWRGTAGDGDRVAAAARAQSAVHVEEWEVEP